MEVLAKAAVAEIHRRVDDSCAVLRLEVSQSRRDIDLLKGKCELMEAELRRSRMRARRKVFHPAAGERFPPLAKAAVSRESQSAEGDLQADAEAQNQPRQCADVEPVNEAEHMQIKEERTEEDVWRNNPEDKHISGAEQPPCFKADSFVARYHSAESPEDPESLGPPADGYNTLNANQNVTELTLKREREEEPDENAAPLDSRRRLVTETGDDQLWPSSLCRDAGDPSSSHAGQQFEQIPTALTPQSGLRLGDAVPRAQSAGKSHSRVKRRARTRGCKRAQGDEGHGALSQINTMDQSSAPQEWQHQCRDFAPAVRNPGEDAMAPNPAASTLCGHSRSSFGVVRRARTPWKRFSCTYCDKRFMRFSQLKEHLRSHTGEKPFSCLQCGRSFTKQCNLIRHAVVHSGEKPYECSLCGKCFTQRSSLKSHQKTAH
ncbi:uncharacterized protein [Trachinotus anak]